MKFILAASGAALAALVSQASAADYFVDGVFTLDNHPPATTAADQDKLQLKCALHFFINNRDGTFAQYFLERPKFQGGGTVSYIKANAGTCKMDDAAKLESCESQSATNGRIESETPSFNFYKELTPDKLTAVSFTSSEEFNQWKAAGGKDEQGTWSQVKCKEITSQLLNGHISEKVNTLGNDDTNKLLYFDAAPTEADYALARRVMDALKK